MWEFLALAMAIKLKDAVETETPDENKIFVAMGLGAFVAAFAILPFTPTF